MYKLFVLFWAISVSAQQEATQNEISTEIQELATKHLKDTVYLDAFWIKLRHIEVTDFKTLKNVGNSVWIKGEGGKLDNMNLTLKLEDFKVKIKEILFGPTRLSGTFEIGENEAEISLTSRPGNCEIDLKDYRLTKMNKVIFRTEMKELDGKDFSAAFQDFMVPIINKISRTVWFKEFTKGIFGKFCKINFPEGGQH